MNPQSSPQIIDISGWQDGTPIDYNQVKGAGIVGVIIKSTDGGILINPWYNRDCDGFNSVGLPIASYHYFEPDVDPATQARAAINNQHAASQGVWLDFEAAGSLSWDQLAERAQMFLNALKSEGVFTGVYTNSDWASNLEPFGFPWGFPFWYAFPLENGPLNRSCQLHQYSQVPIQGISGLVDIDALYVPLQEIFPRLSSTGTSTVEPPVSTPGPNPPAPAPSSQNEVDVLPELQINVNDVFHVQVLQSILNIYAAGLALDGDFGPLTQHAVENFQTQSGIAVDGIVGPITWSHLLRV